MSQITSRRTLSIAMALALTVGAVIVALITQSTDATSAPVESPASQFGVLEPTSASAMDALSEEAETRLAFLTNSLDHSGAEDV